MKQSLPLRRTRRRLVTALPFVLSLSFFINFGAASSAAAKGIERCQKLLLDQKERLAQYEIDSYDHYRSHQSGTLKLLLGLLIAVHEADLEGDSLSQAEAVTYVPVSPPNALKAINSAVAEGLLKVDRPAFVTQGYKYRPGPKLVETLDRELGRQRAAIALLVTSLGAPFSGGFDHEALHAKRVETLLLRKIWYEFQWAWQVSDGKDQALLRTSYGLLAEIYKRGLRNGSILHADAIKLIRLKAAASSIPQLKTAERNEFIKIIQSEDVGRKRYVEPGARLSFFIEQQINLNVELTNRILRRTTSAE